MQPVFDQAEQLLNSLIHGGGQAAPWLHDWSAYSSHVDWGATEVSVPAASWHTFLNVAGEGWLTWARAWGNGGFGVPLPDFRVTVDGGTPAVYLGVSVNGLRQGNDLWAPIPFKTSLKIEVYNRTGGVANLGCNYTYLLKTGTPNPLVVTVQSAGQRRVAQAYQETIGLLDVLNITGTGWLVGITAAATVSSTTSDRIQYLNVVRDGTTIMSNRPVVATTGAWLRMHNFVGPVRFNGSLRVQHRTDNTGAYAHTRVWYVLD